MYFSYFLGLFFLISFRCIHENCLRNYIQWRFIEELSWDIIDYKIASLAIKFEEFWKLFCRWSGCKKSLYRENILIREFINFLRKYLYIILGEILWTHLLIYGKKRFKQIVWFWFNQCGYFTQKATVLHC